MFDMWKQVLSSIFCFSKLKTQTIVCVYIFIIPLRVTFPQRVNHLSFSNFSYTHTHTHAFLWNLTFNRLKYLSNVSNCSLCDILLQQQQHYWHKHQLHSCQYAFDFCQLVLNDFFLLGFSSSSTSFYFKYLVAKKVFQLIFVNNFCQ